MKIKPEFSVTVARNPCSIKRANAEAIQRSIGRLLTRALGTKLSNTWKATFTLDEKHLEGGWLYQVTILFKKFGGRKGNIDVVERESARILGRLADMGSKSYFQPYPWVIRKNDDPIERAEAKAKTPHIKVKANESTAKAGNSVVKEEHIADVSEVGNYDFVTPIEDIHIDPILISGTDEEVEAHPAFSNIYGRAAHIRTAMSVCQAAVETRMQRRHNVLFYGDPGCAKSGIMTGMKQVLGANAYLELDSTATTKAGIEKLFLEGLKTGVPPFVFIEEIEKTDEAALRVWLSALDERREIRKVNYRKAYVRKFDIVCIATANDKEAFDRLFRGGNQKGRGALSSRFTKQIPVPRPDEAILRRILTRDIHTYGGNAGWVDPCIDLAKKLKTDDPREVMGLLVGGARLLDGTYQKDLMSIYKAHKSSFLT